MPQALAMLRIEGAIDVALLDASTPVPAPAPCADGALQIAIPGLTLRWSAGHADVAARDGVVAVCTGRARDLGKDAMAWIERYRRHGDRAADDMGGGFSVAIVDVRDRRALLFVDRFSIETLCYCTDGTRLGFSDCAFQVPNATREIDNQAIYDYLYFHVIPAPQTVFRDVRRLAGGHRLVASGASVEVAAYWTPQFVEDDASDLAGRRARFVHLVEESVRDEADGPATACFLSGGTDSSTVAGMLRKLHGEPTHAYSIGFPTEGYDEMAYARIAARHFGLVHHEHYLSPDDLVSAIPDMARSFDQPFGNSSVLAAYHCALRAREDGFTRMLAGDGGDELFGGNTRYALQKFLEPYHRMPARIRSFIEPLAIRSPMLRRVPGLRQLGGYVRHAHVVMPDRLNNFLLLRQFDEDDLFAPEFRASIDTSKPADQQRAVWRSARAGSLVNRMLSYDWKFTLGDSDLPKVRCAAQLAGVDVGYPLLSAALTDFSLSLPPHWKVRGLKLRWFFKSALRDFLPGAILRKRKHGFGVPFGPWVLQHPALRTLVQRALDGIAERGIVRPPFVRELMTEMLPREPAYYGEMIWLLMMLEQWFDAHAPTYSAERGGLPSGSASRACIAA